MRRKQQKLKMLLQQELAASPREPKFLLAGREHNYYEKERHSERCVEVSLAVDFLGDSPSEDVMEVGNVLRTHSSTRDHFVIDLFEKHPGWPNYANKDCLTFEPSQRFRKVLSISTVEHTADPEKAIRRILSWGDEVLITCPLGYRSQTGWTNDILKKDYGKGVAKLAMMRGHKGIANWREEPVDKLLALPVTYTRWGERWPLTSTAICILLKRAV